jgi:ATP-dependent RNA helicase DHR2
VRKQLRAQCLRLRLPPNCNDTAPQPHSAELVAAILRSFLQGFALNTAVLCDGVYRSLVGRHAVTIHPSSVLYGKKVEAIVYNEFVFTTKSYARGVSAVQLDWVDEELCKDRGGI